ncbi:DUF6897 domain-containing protein [Sporosarcina ureilytica]|uniref:DUF2642 domain-containing protein n=1 Tax=Sporosarcina ureilytica TaxID=298596 RepID=A0A1D8JFQ8_9BACL|nr:type II toxin-antitoxin system HigB family toxin [Sporosarcina ureilytica]AOV07547.1 DUF2642 domain-containing protein [Sporosarcina ureilytica]
MNKIIRNLVHEVVRIKSSGTHSITGTLIDVGDDIIVLFNGKEFMYISIDHIQNFDVDRDILDDIESPTGFPSIIAQDTNKDLSLEEVVTQAIGTFVEIYVTGDQPLYGHITSVMNDYFVFQSPVYQTMYISLHHLKWLIPYTQIKKPYGLDNYPIPVQANKELLASAFDAQVEKFKNKIVVFNISGNKSYLGKLNDFEDQIIEIQTVKTHPIYLNFKHIKTMHQV